MEKRKIALARGAYESWLPDFLSDAWEPTGADLQEIHARLKPTANKYRNIYEPIRNKVFAHRDIGVNINSLFGKTQKSEIEQILNDLRDMLETVEQIYLNGRKPEFNQRTYDDKERIGAIVRSVMRRLTETDKSHD